MATLRLREDMVKLCIDPKLKGEYPPQVDKMESSISAVTYKGSIPEAILESKKQKKLFVVYISGENVESAELEKSTWADSKVGWSRSQSTAFYCISKREALMP
ncbi:hypothetical protein NC652_037678 [Populus alba x Populus x berolinensis]|nr:hypothetical protein NC652_037678 [Populus alba x Populus x berolinensis]